MADTFVGTIGLKIRVRLCTDISADGDAYILVKKPDGTTDTWTATIENAAEGIISYLTEDGDLDQAGTYAINGKWAPDSGEVFFGATACFVVKNPGEC